MRERDVSFSLVADLYVIYILRALQEEEEEWVLILCYALHIHSVFPLPKGVRGYCIFDFCL